MDRTKAKTLREVTLTTEQADALIDELVRIQRELDSGRAFDTAALLAAYGRQAEISATLREQGGFTADMVAARLFSQLAH